LDGAHMFVRVREKQPQIFRFAQDDSFLVEPRYFAALRSR